MSLVKKFHVFVLLTPFVKERFYPGKIRGFNKVKTT